MNLKKLIFTENNCYKAGRKIVPQGIMVHSTGANNPKLSRYVGPDDGLLGENKHNNHWNHPTPGGRRVCPHAFIGKLQDDSIATYQTLPWDHRGWHAGGKANDTHIGFEICEDGLTDKTYFNAVYKEAVELCAYLCAEFNLDPMADGVIIGHYEGYQKDIASNHGDPRHWFVRHGKSMDSFRKDVKKEMKPKSKPKSDTLYRVQTGAFKVKSNAGTLLKKVKNAGFDTYMVKADGLYKVQVGAYSVKANADAMAKKLKAEGFDVYITTQAGTPVISEPKPNPKQTWEYYINGQEVRNLQSELNKQFKANIKVDGYMGDKTIAALRTVKQGARGNLTRIIQRRLIALGYGVGRAGTDGVFGVSTYNAVVQFQRSNGLVPDGAVGKHTWKELFKK